MCGICGIVGHSPDQELLVRMNNRITHRGPDDGGIYLNQSVGLGHRRLSIIDLAGGHQPMFSEDRSVVLVYNGEIYNYLELKQELEKEKHQFKTHSDSETIVHLYEREGENCLSYFRGAFAFAIWDEKEKKLFAARDRFGIKPFYYTLIDGTLYFASELKAFLEIPNLTREVEFKALDLYLRFQFIPAPWTLLKNVYRLPAAHYLTFQNGQLRTKKYWQLNYKDKIKGLRQSYMNNSPQF